MMPKIYTAHQAAEILGIEYRALQKQLVRDTKKDKKLRKYPHAHKCLCGYGWMIPAKDIKTVNRKKIGK